MVRRLLTGLAGATTLSCTLAGSHAAPGDAAFARIVQTVGDARCTADSECRTLAVGNRPCGGPERFLAWSVRDADGRHLQRLAAAYAESARKASPDDDPASTCQVLIDPGARCERAAGAATGVGRCVLRMPPDPRLGGDRR